MGKRAARGEGEDEALPSEHCITSHCPQGGWQSLAVYKGNVLMLCQPCTEQVLIYTCRRGNKERAADLPGCCGASHIGLQQGLLLS